MSEKKERRFGHPEWDTIVTGRNQDFLQSIWLSFVSLFYAPSSFVFVTRESATQLARHGSLAAVALFALVMGILVWCFARLVIFVSGFMGFLVIAAKPAD